ncbi:DUF5049 domain-containing protein [Heliophilum fasciatum]|uniref:Uncharacterized protein DUF5049 n=1 Tax=Heliophilum fasciatum TaxID=35700 RepID=A0A4R2RHS9_9FIRM|nr:DUF5049 domain-containing protein [Heliophilum fasciatum]MCW2278707.1 hypothetical protein [Heliophilum fasciatum]TCP62553.1 uncharacterized protein DUF5049 [Heliophilum fasciatum]
MITIPKAVKEMLEQVRLSGKTNMLDTHAVQRVAYDMEFYRLVLWIEEHREDYFQGCLEGFQVVEDKEERD